MPDVDLIAKLVEQLISLLKEGVANKRKLFDDHVDPIYQRMLAVRQELESGFDDLRGVIASAQAHIDREGATPAVLSAPVVALVIRREKSQRERSELRRYLEVLRSQYGDHPSGMVPANANVRQLVSIFACDAFRILSGAPNLEVTDERVTDIPLPPLQALIRSDPDDQYSAMRLLLHQWTVIAVADAPPTEKLERMNFELGCLQSLTEATWKQFSEAYHVLRVKCLR